MSDEICSICLNNFNNKISTTCLHFFCKECIRKWLLKNNTCPMCRSNINKLNFNNQSLYFIPIIQNSITKYTNIININIEYDRYIEITFASIDELLLQIKVVNDDEFKEDESLS